MASAVRRMDLPMSLIFGKSYERLGAHSAPRESCRACSRSPVLALSVERLRKSCKPQLDASRVACLRPHADQALLAFAARFWCPEVGLLNLLSQALNERTGVLPSPLCCRVGWLAGLRCQGRGMVGPRRTTCFTLRPSSGRGAWPCPAGEGGTAGLPSHPAVERLPRSLTPTRQHKRTHAYRCRFVPA